MLAQRKWSATRTDQQREEISRHPAMPATPAHSKAVGPETLRQAVKPSTVAAETARQHNIGMYNLPSSSDCSPNEVDMSCTPFNSFPKQLGAGLETPECAWWEQEMRLESCYGEGDRLLEVKNLTVSTCLNMFQKVSTSLCSAVFTYLPVTLPIISSYIFSCFITFLYIFPTNCAFERDFEDAARRLRHRRLRGAACGMTWTSTPSPVARANISNLGQKCQMQIPETWRPMETDGDLWNMCFRTPHLLWHQQRQPLCCYKGRSF